MLSSLDRQVKLATLSVKMFGWFVLWVYEPQLHLSLGRYPTLTTAWLITHIHEFIMDIKPLSRQLVAQSVISQWEAQIWNIFTISALFLL